MSKCPYCNQEIVYDSRQVDTEPRCFPLLEVFCSKCKKVINVTIVPDYYLDTINDAVEKLLNN